MKLSARFLLASAIAFGFPAASFAAQEVIQVYKSAYCGCCQKWVEHLRQAGFDAQVTEVEDVSVYRKKLNMPDKYASCHTAKIGGYVLEGHIPTKDIQRLMKEKPKALGLTVPGMPAGSPGMETTSPVPYETLLVSQAGSSTVFAKH